MSNYERTRAEKIFWTFEKIVNDFFYEHPALQKGAPGWLLRLLGSPFRLYRHKIWNRFAYNKDGRMTNTAALRTVTVTLVAVVVLAWVVLALF